MHRTHEVAVLTLDMNPKPGFLRNMEIINISYLPFPVKFAKEYMQLDAMEAWIKRRIMSEHRYNLQSLIDITQKNVMELSLESYGLTVTDGYWFCPEKDQLYWKDINFFEHDFRYDVGNMIFGIQNKHPVLLSPDLTTNGQMEKAWRKRDGYIWLLKKGAPPNYEEPFNERIVSKLLEKFSKVPFVSYDVVFVCRHAASVCKNFTEDGIEFISAADLAKTGEKPFFLNMEDHLRERCRYFNIPGYDVFLDQIHILDYIIANQDRHLGNYGFLYDTIRNEFLGPAPIFDNGSSLWCQDAMIQIETGSRLKESMVEYIKHIHRPEEILLPELTSYEICDIVEGVYAESAITTDRAHSIGINLANRYNNAKQELERIAEIRYMKSRASKNREKNADLEL